MKKLFSVYVLSVLTVAMLAVTGCSKEDDTDGAPVACINVTTANPSAGSPVAFTSCSTGADTYKWEFTNPTATVTTANASHTYAANGSYTVTLTVTNAKGSNTTTKTVVVGSSGTTAANYAGTYSVTTTCGNTYSAVVTSSNDTITIKNFNRMNNQTVKGKVSGNTATFWQQNIGNTPTYITATTATLSSDKDKLTMSYSVNEAGSSPITCTFNGDKQ